MYQNFSLINMYTFQLSYFGTSHILFSLYPLLFFLLCLPPFFLSFSLSSCIALYLPVEGRVYLCVSFPLTDIGISGLRATAHDWA
jgi:hypothetical protein